MCLILHAIISAHTHCFNGLVTEGRSILATKTERTRPKILGNLLGQMLTANATAASKSVKPLVANNILWCRANATDVASIIIAAVKGWQPNA